MIAYFDTSAFLKLVLEEVGSDRARELWRSCEQAVSSVLLYTECRAGLAMAHRMGRLSDLVVAGQRIETLYAQVFAITVSEPLARRAGRLAEDHGQRGYDAVHLACAELVRDPDLVFVSTDGRQTEAAAALGLAVAAVPNLEGGPT